MTPETLADYRACGVSVFCVQCLADGGLEMVLRGQASALSAATVVDGDPLCGAHCA